MIVHEQLLLQFLQNADLSAFKTELAKTGLPTVKYQDSYGGFYLASKYNPVKAGEDYANANYRDCGNLAIYGLGLGYHIISLIQKLKANQQLYIFECSLASVKLALELTEIRQYLEKDNVYLYAAGDLAQIGGWMKQRLNEPDIHFMIYEPALKILPAHLMPLQDLLAAYRTKIKTHYKEDGLVAENSRQNLSKNYRNGGALLKGVFQGLPLLIISAGYSLNLNAYLLKQAREKAVLLSVGRIALFLEEQGVTPDFYIEIDPKNGAYTYFLSKARNQNPPLLLLSTACKELEGYQGEKLLLYEKFSAATELRETAVEAGGSVATVAASFAVLSGASPVLLVGQDLCYISDYTHAGALRPVVKTRTGKQVMGTDGKTYYCPENLYHYLRWFERFIAKNPATQFVNLTAIGADIAGAEHREMEAYLQELPPVRQEIDKRIRRCLHTGS